MERERPCTFLIHNDTVDIPVSQLKEQLENGDLAVKISALKKIILLTLNGQPLPQLLMSVIRFCMPQKDKTMKKLLLLFWELCEKTGPDGKLLHEMILVCSHFRNDLNHPNEYVRGSTLRFLCKLKEAEILEPLVPSVRANLEYRHAYVRRNAVLAVYSIYKAFSFLIPDASELIFNFLNTEGDAACKRNAFIMLFNCDQDKAIEYLSSVIGQVNTFGDILQIIVIELIRKVCKSTASGSDRAKYLKCLFELLKAPSPAVQFEAAGALVGLTSAPTAVRAAAATFIQLLCNEADNNVKIIVTDKLDAIRQKHKKTLQPLLMDILRALSTPNMDIRKKTLDIALDLVSPQNIDEAILYLKKEIAKTQVAGFEKGGEYRQMLIQAIHACAVKYPSVASNVVLALMDFLGDANIPTAVEVVTFVREVAETYPELRESILRKLFLSLKHITASSVYRTALWVLGEYALTTDDIDQAFSTLKGEIGALPLVKDGSEDESEGGDKEKKEKADVLLSPQPSSRPAILADGTYATQSAFSVPKITAPQENEGSLRRLLEAGDFFLGSALSTTLTKLVLRSFLEEDLEASQKHAFAVEVLLIMVNILKLGKSPQTKNQIDDDSYGRICSCIRILSDGGFLSRKHNGADEAEAEAEEEEDGAVTTTTTTKASSKPRQASFIRELYLQFCRDSFSDMLRQKQKEDAEKKKEKDEQVSVQADDLLVMRQLRANRVVGADEADDLEDDLGQVTGLQNEDSKQGLQLNRLRQLTGLSDPVYAEAYVQVHVYDIVLDVLVINQTPDTLQNLCLELATLGDLKLCERPRNYNLGPFDSKRIRANIKVSSTETGIIFGNIVYDVAGQATTLNADKNCVILNDIHIDIMDYISPAQCTHVDFRNMWSEFEWENKVVVNTEIRDVNEYLEHIMKVTNMGCLTPKKALEGECGFISANLYAKSVFGEDALANLSIERQPETGKIEGSIRIRSKKQGIALSLGDKITSSQRTNKTKEEVKAWLK